MKSLTSFLCLAGKCMTCAHLAHLRRKYKGVNERRYITMLHLYHKGMYMGERIEYSKRRNNAEREPDVFCSMISDGMAQNHCKLPWWSNNKDVTPMVQHLQGVLNHGRFFNVYRTFDNISNGANLAMYCFLSSLEEVYLKEGKLPDTVYHQV